jgi:DNA-directed RNA polymerase specialized sigma24 family protein
VHCIELASSFRHYQGTSGFRSVVEQPDEQCRASMASATTKEMLSSGAYASTADFERIFTEDMSSLYLLSFLLTGDRDRAEECFITGVEESTKANRVFKEWARSWARRTIIQSAIRLITPRLRSVRTTQNPVSPRHLDYVPLALEAEACAILELATLERFVFVMSVLERYSEHDCSILLGCSRRDVAAALARALQHLGRLMNFHKNKADAGSEGLSRPETSRLVLQMTIARYFATADWNTRLFP